MQIGWPKLITTVNGTGKDLGAAIQKPIEHVTRKNTKPGWRLETLSGINAYSKNHVKFVGTRAQPLTMRIIQSPWT
jgi:hypothetical protein